MAVEGNRDTLEVLKTELDFIEKGGYHPADPTAWRAKSIFQDSPTCLNFKDPQGRHPCDECRLISFVPSACRKQRVPCHHIPLTETGDTVESVERWADQQELEEVVKSWLRRTIKQLEQGRAEASLKARRTD